uniref:Guanine nucleotide-binding protein alpha-2 subunit n=1 Tax=Rhizophora mucronata TaxID=61149 RepID=A0A2P2N3E0_RHIMU
MEHTHGLLQGRMHLSLQWL